MTSRDDWPCDCLCHAVDVPDRHMPDDHDFTNCPDCGGEPTKTISYRWWRIWPSWRWHIARLDKEGGQWAKKVRRGQQ